MSDQSLLCKCTFCLDENVNGVLLNRKTYNCYRLRIQEYSVRDENLEYMNLQTEENMNLHAKENMSSYAKEDINLQEDNLNLVDENSDTKSFNFNEEDNEYYSDYNDDDDNDDDDDYDDDDDNNDNDDNDDEDNDNNTMCVDDKTNIPIEELKLLHLKSLYNFTESAYDNIMKIFIINNVSLYKAKKYLKETTGLIPTFYDMCENSCICYTEQYESYQNCMTCDSTRLDTRGKAKKVMSYLSVKDRLKIQFSDKNRAKELLYCYEYITNKENNNLDDIFDGKIYKEFVDENLFSDKRDMIFIASCDEYQIFKQKTDDCWLFLMINNNLDSSLRVKKENLLIPFLISEPNQPKDFNTFL